MGASFEIQVVSGLIIERKKLRLGALDLPTRHCVEDQQGCCGVSYVDCSGSPGFDNVLNLANINEPGEVGYLITYQNSLAFGQETVDPVLFDIDCFERIQTEVIHLPDTHPAGYDYWSQKIRFSVYRRTWTGNEVDVITLPYDDSVPVNSTPGATLGQISYDYSPCTLGISLSPVSAGLVSVEHNSYVSVTPGGDCTAEAPELPISEGEILLNIWMRMKLNVLAGPDELPPIEGCSAAALNAVPDHASNLSAWVTEGEETPQTPSYYRTINSAGGGSSWVTYCATSILFRS